MVGKAEGQIRIEKGCSQESSRSKAYESGDEEEVVRDDESALGGEEEGWRYNAVKLKSVNVPSRW